MFCNYRERKTHRQFPNFAFVDAGNLIEEFEGNLMRLGYGNDQLTKFDLTELFKIDQRTHSKSHDRIYIYHALDEIDAKPNWLSKLEGEAGFVIRLGRLTDKSGTKKQQGVDVLLAIEAIQLSYAKAMASCHIYSFDGDFLPLVDALVDNGTIVTVSAFSNPAKGDVGPKLRQKADKFEKLTKLDLQNCLKGIKISHPSGWKNSRDPQESKIEHPVTGEIVTYYTIEEADEEGFKVVSGVKVDETINLFMKFKNQDDFVFWLKVRPDGPSVDLNSNLIVS